MHLDASFLLSEQSPLKGAQAQINCRRIKGIDISVKLEDIDYPTPLSFCYDLVGKLLEDAVIALGVGIRKSTLGSMLAKSKVIRLRCVSLSCQNNISKTFAIGKLAEHQYTKLVVAGKLFDIFVSAIFPCEIVEIIAIEEV